MEEKITAKNCTQKQVHNRHWWKTPMLKNQALGVPACGRRPLRPSLRSVAASPPPGGSTASRGCMAGGAFYRRKRTLAKNSGEDVYANGEPNSPADPDIRSQTGAI